MLFYGIGCFCSGIALTSTRTRWPSQNSRPICPHRHGTRDALPPLDMNQIEKKTLYFFIDIEPHFDNAEIINSTNGYVIVW
mgnify:CR=1 FL=1